MRLSDMSCIPAQTGCPLITQQHEICHGVCEETRVKDICYVDLGGQEKQPRTNSVTSYDKQ